MEVKRVKGKNGKQALLLSDFNVKESSYLLRSLYMAKGLVACSVLFDHLDTEILESYNNNSRNLKSDFVDWYDNFIKRLEDIDFERE